MRHIMLAALAIALLLATPAALAHTTQDTGDGQYLITVGNRNEPVYTYVPTGLDLIIRENNTERTPVLNAHLQDLEATLVAPNGETMTRTLVAQFGNPGRYSFDEGYTLSEPGEYFLELEGDLFGSTVDDRILVGSGPLEERTFFPDENIMSPAEMQQHITALEARLAALEVDDGNPAPGLAIPLAMVALVGAALLRNRP